MPTVINNGLAVNTLTEANIQAVLTSEIFTANSVAVFTVGSGAYLGINDNVVGFSATTDSIINITGITGSLDLNNFT